ncbi:MAG TPA: PAS domain S-box protein [Geomonas sp.]|nr:PAS domain S-box protein [Geomonas sp.]
MPSEKIKLLLIDDDLAEAGRITGMLAECKRHRYLVRHAESLAQGLELLRKGSFHCILTDLSLPDSQGLETAQAVRNHAKQTPIIIVTSLDDEETALKALQMDIQDYLVSEEITGSVLGRSICHARQRKRAEDALRLSEARYRALYCDNPTMIVTLDAGLTVLSVNPFCASQLGYSVEELEGKPVLPIFHQEDRPLVAEQLQRCLQNPKLRHRWQFRKLRKDGSVLWVEEMAQAVYDLNGALNVLVVCQDISDRKRAEEALRKSERKFSRIFHAAPALIGISTLKDGRFVDVNEMALETLGYRREEMIGRTARELGLWGDDADQARLLKSLQKRKSVQNLEIRFKGKDGRTFIGLLSADVVDLNGDRYLLSLMRDITDRRHAEEEIERLNTDLAARAFELECANEELEAFNYTVAHDLRKPLTVVNAYCQAIREFCGSTLDELCSDYLQQAYEGTLRMNQLIDALLNFSRMARVELHRETVDLSKVAQEAAEELKVAEPGRRVTFRLAAGVTAEGDASLLRVVLDNLLANAWKFTACRQQALVEFGRSEADGRQVFFVRDNGSGFEMADADKLFLPFQRLSTPQEVKGFGIGLATVARIVRRHGGKIWAEGAPGQGATFYFTLS